MKKVLLLVTIMLLCATMAYAGCVVCDKAASESYGEKTTYRFVRGLGNTAFGWAEIFFRPSKEMAQGTPFATAVVAGLGNSLVRTGNGVLELLTFWNPGKEDIGGVKDCPICAMK